MSRSRRGSPSPQEAVWFLDQLEPNQALHNVPCAVRLAGTLEAEVLERALGEIVRRHETLRTRFELVDGKPYQVVSPAGGFEMPRVDLSDRPAAEREGEALRLATEEAHRVFDLEQGPLFHAFLIRLGEAEHVLVFNFHHTVTDGVSMAVFTRELDALYRAFSAGEASPLPDLEVQFADFAVWQRKMLVGDKLEEHLAYWRGQLAGDVKALALPTDRPRPAVMSFQGGHCSVRLSKHLSEALRGLSQAEGVTLGMTLTAAFEVLLVEATGTTDVVIGSAVAHRNRRELEGLIAFLVNMVVLRTDLSGDPTFGEILAKVREATLGACAHQELPLTRVLTEVAPERDLSKSPLFQVEFSLLTPDQNPAVYGYGLGSAPSTETLEPGGPQGAPRSACQVRERALRRRGLPLGHARGRSRAPSSTARTCSTPPPSPSIVRALRDVCCASCVLDQAGARLSSPSWAASRKVDQEKRSPGGEDLRVDRPASA